MRKRKLSRRTFLRSSGVALGLPLLNCMLPSGVRAARDAGEARRLVAICAPLGIHTPHLFPEKAGKDYEVMPYLEKGKWVRVKSGPLKGLEGIVQRMKGKTRVVLNVDMIKQAVAMEIDSSILAPL